MKLSVKFLKNVENVNNFQYIKQWEISEGSDHDLYFQVIDKLKEDLRYMSQDPDVEMKVQFQGLDSDSPIEKEATQPFVDDKSIWKITLSDTETPNSGAVRFAITENEKTKTFNVEQAIVVDLLNFGGC
jgi:hypothetical protein